MNDAWPKHSEIVNANGRGDIHRGIGMTRGFSSLWCSLFWSRVKGVCICSEDEDDDGFAADCVCELVVDFLRV
jgi:hypothetical protein